MSLKPQDVLVVLKLTDPEAQQWSFAELARALGMSSSEVHAAVGRAQHAGLLHSPLSGEGRKPNALALLNFIRHGVRYAFAPTRGAMTRGMPTAEWAPALSDAFAPSSEPPLVWPDAEGKSRGMAFEPLYRSAPHAARNDPRLYDLLALVDALRGSGARARNLAFERLEARLSHAH
jgi:biotin operon repressor